jgi:hypothetical protein
MQNPALVFAAAAIISVAWTGHSALANPDSSGGPARGHSSDPDDRTGHSRSLDSADHGTSESPDDRRGRSEDPGDRRGFARNPCSLVAVDQDPDGMTGRSTDLGDLRDSGGSGSEAELVPAVSPPGPSADASALAAWRQVESAESNLNAINDVYQNMLANDYPRGDRRARILTERNDAIEGVNRARTHYSQLTDSR